MARLTRYVLPGQPQHIIQRGNNRCLIFQEENDYFFYLEKLKKAAEDSECDIHAYVLMTNHVHLLATPHKEDSLSKMQQIVGRSYVRYFNQCYRRTGTLFEGRYKAILIDSEAYLFICMGYIELNPVRAKMVDKPSNYRWSSYHFNALGQADSLIQVHSKYNALGSSSEARQQAYKELCDQRIPKKTLEDIRLSTNKGWALGSSTFKQDIETRLNRKVGPAVKGGDRKSQEYKLKIK
jgi:putative transposase